MEKVEKVGLESQIPSFYQFRLSVTFSQAKLALFFSSFHPVQSVHFPLEVSSGLSGVKAPVLDIRLSAPVFGCGK